MTKSMVVSLEQMHALSAELALVLHAHEPLMHPAVMAAACGQVLAAMVGHITTLPNGTAMTDDAFQLMLRSWLATFEEDAWAHRNGECADDPETVQ